MAVIGKGDGVMLRKYWPVWITAAALLVILWGALFLLAPAWQFGYDAVSYEPASMEVDLNSAQEAELRSLPGVGETKAAAIIAYREANGPFADLASVAKVEGISENMIEKWAGLAVCN